MELALEEADEACGDSERSSAIVDDRSYYYMGGLTLRVPVSMFEENRRRLCAKLRELECHCVTGGMVLLQGGQIQSFYTTDIEYIFQQEPYFHWAFGLLEPNCYAAILVETAESILFVPRLPDEYKKYVGNAMSLCDFKNKYDVSRVAYVDQMKYVLEAVIQPPNVILGLKGRNSDSGLAIPPLNFEGIEKFTVDYTMLFDIMTECRVIKTPMEIEVIRYATRIASEAHKMVMRKIEIGMKEYQCESIFRHFCYFVGGCRHTSYIPICASGVNSSILHYGQVDAPNAKTIKDGDMCMFDMGCQYYGYASDIACSFPANGVFSSDQRLIYNAVLDANRAVIKKMKPGVSWVDMHLLANRVLLVRLIEGGLLFGDINDMMTVMLASVFQPHGLGHFLGCDVHDVGGYLRDQPERPTAPGLNKLRTARVLQEGMVITVEPGCYFIKSIIDEAIYEPALKDFFVLEVLERFEHFGGVRIEDVVLVKEKGVEVLSDVPRKIYEIEEWMQQTEYDLLVNDLIYAKSSLKSLSRSTLGEADSGTGSPRVSEK